jgi:hypothetical protein
MQQQLQAQLQAEQQQEQRVAASQAEAANARWVKQIRRAGLRC